jgi:hypothetical protein
VKPFLRNADSTAIDSKLMVKLANGSILTVPKRSVLLSTFFDGLSGKDSFLLLDLDDLFDAILGMSWLIKYCPSIDWVSQSLKFPHGEVISFNTCPSDGHEDIVNVTVIYDHNNGPVCDGPDASIVIKEKFAPVRLSNRYDVLSENKTNEGRETCEFLLK